VSGRPRILILGAAGQVGQELKRSFADTGDIIACSRTSADLASPDQLRAMVRNTAPDVILNAAAYTAVDRAESEPKLAMAVNALAPGILAEEALRAGALLVHYSTDYVFDGTKTGPWEETDVPNPLNVYGASKLAGEDEIRRVGGRYLIFRTSWVYGPHGKNFLLTMLRLGRERDSLDIVDDQIGTPTSSIELADVTRDIISGILEGRFGSTNSWTGLYHMTCGGSVSWCGFAQAIFTRAQALLDGKIPRVNPIPSSEYPAAARRPQNSALSNEKLYSRFSIRLAPWESALDMVVMRLTLQQQLAQD
jgi:dTDP-4-dehydrorhamnose reductase